MSPARGESHLPYFRHTAGADFLPGGRFDMDFSIIDLLQLTLLLLIQRVIELQQFGVAEDNAE